MTHWFFDFDGTLCDTDADIRLAWRRVIGLLGRECPQFDALYKTGPRLDVMARQLFPDADDALVARVRELFQPAYDECGFPNTRPYPWVAGWLAGLRGRGDRLYLATNKRVRPLRLLLAKLGWESWFDAVYAPDMAGDGRLPSKGELLRGALAAHGIASEDAVMVGDTRGDIEAGREARMRTVGCTWGYGSREDLEGADELYNAARFA